MTAVARKVHQHPGIESTPIMTLAEAVGIAQAGEMQDVCVMYTDKNGAMHIAWSQQSDADLAAYSVVLSNVAAARLIGDE